MITRRVDSIRDMRLKEKGIVPPSSWDDLAEVRRVKLEEAGAACTEAIYAGVEVGGKRYSLKDHDQTEIMAQLQSVKAGAAAVPYHADGELCRMYAAADFTEIAEEATTHIFVCRTYCNHLNAWIRRASMKQLDKIYYGAELPKDLADSMAALVGGGSGG